MNHPENEGVIRIFVMVFAAVIIVPLFVVFMLHRYVLPYCLLDWTVHGKENLLVLIGVGVAHFIGILYTCFAWSGEDRIPAHILDAREEARNEGESDGESESGGSNENGSESEEDTNGE